MQQQNNPSQKRNRKKKQGQEQGQGQGQRQGQRQGQGQWQGQDQSQGDEQRQPRGRGRGRGRGDKQSQNYQSSQVFNQQPQNQQDQGREKRKARQRKLIAEENARIRKEEKLEVDRFQEWLNDSLNIDPNSLQQEIQEFQDISSLFSRLTITYNQFEIASNFVSMLIKNYAFQKSIQNLNFVLRSAWFNTQLFERCTILIDQAKQIRYLRQEMEKIHNLFFPALNLVSNSLRISSISSIFHMQKIIENYFPEFQFKDLFNSYDKLLLSLYRTARQNEFRETPIYPVSLEFNNFCQKDQQLFGNIVKLDQAQNHLESYLDYHFNILREDYIRDLRGAISSLNETGFYNIDKEKVSNVNLYQNVQLVSVSTNNFEVIWGISIEQFNLDGRKPKSIDWSRSKKLGEGSLICITNIECFPLIFGIITYRTDKQNQYSGNKENSKKRIFLEFKFIDQRQLIMPFINLLSQQTVLIQYEDLIEPVLYYLESLKFKKELPFSKIIMGNQKQIAMPDHLIQKSVYVLDFSGHSTYERGYQVDLSTNQLPKIPSTLDQSQLNAIKVMLVNNVALVQGPPGTGKTYCGALAVRALFYNIQKQHFPILIVCYTNHALDQFLEHIIKFVPAEDVARLGGSCKNPALQECVFRCKTQTFQFEWDEFKIIKRKLQKILERMLNYNYKPNSDLLRKHWPQLYDKIISCFINDNELEEEDFDEDHEKYFVDCWLKNEIPGEQQVNYNGYFNGVNRYFQNNELTNDFQIRQLFSKQLTPGQEQQMKQKDSSDEELDDYLDSEDEAAYKGYNSRQMVKNDELEIRDAINSFNSNFQNLNKLHYNFEGIEILKSELARYNSDPWHLNKNDIYEIRQFLKSLAYQTDSLKYDDTFQKFQQMSQRLRKIYDDNEIKLLNEKKIVGVTVTGVAKQVNKLSQLNAKIMVIEEAAEVLESHVVSILTKNLDHLILIGDHQQLRPTLKCYELEKKFEANISLFERLVKKQIPVAVLKQQRRMKTKFADFIRQIYGNSYEDHQDINKLNKIEINGLATDLLFFNHKWLEAQDEKSKINKQEAEMIFRMAQYLMKMGYKEDQISILTLYLKQAQFLKRKFVDQKQLKVKVQTVDNYQGEENDIVIISLVRNNNFNKLGYISIENRINVALSRARIGLYVFGNFDFIKKASGQGSMWEKMITLAKQKQCLQDFIPLKCKPHGNITNISKPEEWDKIKPGFCNQKCKMVFQNCNHQCEKQCHLDDHPAEKCPYKCNRTIDCGHSCKQMCKEKCICKEQVQIILSCGHQVVAQCGTDPYSFTCNEQCKVNFGKCGHEQKYICYERAKYKNTCYQQCNKIMNCGHQCKKQCWEQCQPCKEICNKGILPCGHQSLCYKLCYLQCDPCQLQCVKKRDCGHDLPCQKKCYEQCTPCSIMLEKTLPCGHQAQICCYQKDQQIQCQKIVNHQLECGHVGQFVCSKLNSQVALFQCQQQCLKKRPCGHSQPCFNVCSNKFCTPCDETVNLTLKCGHNYQTICYQQPKDLNSIQCLDICNKKRECGHNYLCLKKCFEKCCFCLQPIKHQFQCGHSKEFLCYNYKTEVSNFKCQEKCEKKRPCGHDSPCQNVCSNNICTPCVEVVEVTLECGHKNKKPCYLDIKLIKCQQPCDKRRDCGHLVPCSKLCFEKCSPCNQLVLKKLNCNHSLAVECANFNYEVICRQPCAKQRQCGHELPCQNLCYQQCGPCTTTYLKKAICGHEVKVQCNTAEEDLKAYKCFNSCIKPRKCGHSYPCNNICGLNKECTPCLALVQNNLDCGHSVDMQCFQKDLNQKVICDMKCKKPRPCGHFSPCFRKCYEMCSPCLQQTQVTLACGHQANTSCFLSKDKISIAKIVCLNKCERKRSCGHLNQPCLKQCNEACDPCQEIVKRVLNCGHLISVPCYQFSQNLTCQKPCQKTRACGHKCNNYCGQSCEPCQILVDYTFPKCSHQIQVQCNLSKQNQKCQQLMQIKLKCQKHTVVVKCDKLPLMDNKCKECNDCQIQ